METSHGVWNSNPPLLPFYGSYDCLNNDEEMETSLSGLAIGLLLFLEQQTASYPQCVDSSQYYAELQPEWAVLAFHGEHITFMCTTNIPSPYPSHWEINDFQYAITRLPPGFTANGLDLTFSCQTNVTARCLFKVYLNESVVDICSNTATIQCEEAQDPCKCQEVKTAIFNHVNNSNMVLTMGSQQNHLEQCIVSVTLPFEHSCEIKYSCYMQRKYIRSDYSGIVTDSLFNDITCDLHSDHKLCVQWGVSNVTDCYEDPRRNDGANLSTFYSSVLENHTRKVNRTGIENGTIISVFCMRRDCKDNPTHMTIFNTVIETCDSCDTNAECKEGQCVCKDGYTGNGVSCAALRGKSVENGSTRISAKMIFAAGLSRLLIIQILLISALHYLA